MKVFLKILICVILHVPVVVSAASHYVRAGATGNGTDWANAFPSLPATLVRGDTYYIADGNYPDFKVNDAVNGTDYIFILKATTAADGTEIGWENTYGDGQAIFRASESLGATTPTINIATSYIILDGMVGNGADPDSYGFKVLPRNADCSPTTYLVGVPGIGYSSLSISNVRISHVAMINCGDAGGAWSQYTQVGVYSFPENAFSMELSNNYFSDGSSNIVMRKWSNGTIANNYFNRNWSSSLNHGQQISPGMGCSGVILKNNIFKDSTIFVVGAHTDNNYGWRIFNNIIIGGNGMTAAFANADSGTANVVKQWEVHHNTFYNVNLGGRGALFVGNLSDVGSDRSSAYNNLFYNCTAPRFDNPSFTANAILHTQNAHFNSTGIFDNSEGGTAQILSTSPLIAPAVNNYGLKFQTSAGKILPSPFNLDYQGRPRTHFDRGAFEYTGKIPSQITTLRFEPQTLQTVN